MQLKVPHGHVSYAKLLHFKVPGHQHKRYSPPAAVIIPQETIIPLDLTSCDTPDPGKP